LIRIHGLIPDVVEIIGTPVDLHEEYQHNKEHKSQRIIYLDKDTGQGHWELGIAARAGVWSTRQESNMGLVVLGIRVLEKYQPSKRKDLQRNSPGHPSSSGSSGERL
jgi:hypothetical protein